MHPFDADISRADTALDAGSSVEAVAIAQQVLASAVASKDPWAEAKALACLANCDRLLSRFRRSHYASRRAADLFAQVDDPAGEAAALGTLAHAASALGRDDEAVEAGLRAVHVAQRLGDARPLAVAKIQLGIAYLFGRSPERAHSTLDDAVYLSKTSAPKLSPFQVRVTQGGTEVARGITEGCLGQSPASGERLQFIVSAGSQLLRSGDDDAIASGVRVSARALWHLVSATTHVWSGDFARADAELHTAVQWMSKFGMVTSLDSLAALVRAERACAALDWEGSERHGRSAIDLATRAEHQQFARMGFLVVGRALKHQERFEEALACHHESMVREQSIRVSSLNEKATRRRTPE